MLLPLLLLHHCSVLIELHATQDHQPAQSFRWRSLHHFRSPVYLPAIQTGRFLLPSFFNHQLVPNRRAAIPLTYSAMRPTKINRVLQGTDGWACRRKVTSRTCRALTTNLKLRLHRQHRYASLGSSTITAAACRLAVCCACAVGTAIVNAERIVIVLLFAVAHEASEDVSHTSADRYTTVSILPDANARMHGG